SQRDNLLSSVFHPVSHCEAQTRFANNALAFFYVGAFEPNNDRNFHTQVLCSAHDSARNHVAADNTAENIDEHCAHMFVRQQNAKCGFHSFLRCPAADIQKICRFAAGKLDDVHRGHRQPGAVHHAGDIAVELDVVEIEL